MKALAMYCIIAGHCGVPGNEYLYVFSVPCFFIISGFLTKREKDNHVFWRKIRDNLFVPMCILFLINIAYHFASLIRNDSFSPSYLIQAPVLFLIGMQGRGFPAGGLGALWYVYTLIICRILFQFIPENKQKWVLLFINLSFLLGSWLLHLHGVVVYNAFVDVLLAMPFFTIGILLRPFRSNLCIISYPWAFLILLIGVCGVWICGTHNETVLLYSCGYGNNMFLCFLGSICGTSVIYALSRLLEHSPRGFARIIGGGTLIILGLHYPIMVQIVSKMIPLTGAWLYVEAFVILLAFVPIIMFVKKSIPSLYGKSRIDSLPHASLPL